MVFVFKLFKLKVLTTNHADGQTLRLAVTAGPSTDHADGQALRLAAHSRAANHQSSIVSAAPVVLMISIFVGVNKSEKLRMNLSGS